jgi:hypothetical protein
MVEAEHLECARSSATNRLEVISWIDQKPIGTLGEITALEGVDDLAGAADKDAAALSRRRFASVSNDCVQRSLRKSTGITHEF